MRLDEIRRMPTVVNNNHESLMRSYQTLQKVKEWLTAGAPASVVLELIMDIEQTAPGTGEWTAK